jgi:hypothetical protein
MRLAYCVDGILFSEALAAEGAVVFTHARELGLEGIVSTRRGSIYRRGMSATEDEEPGAREDVTSCPRRSFRKGVAAHDRCRRAERVAGRGGEREESFDNGRPQTGEPVAIERNILRPQIADDQRRS